MRISTSRSWSSEVALPGVVADLAAAGGSHGALRPDALRLHAETPTAPLHAETPPARPHAEAPTAWLHAETPTATSTRVVFGPGARCAIPDVMRSLLCTSALAPRALVVASASSAGRRWRSELIAELGAFGVSVHEHPPGGPTEATVTAVADAARAADVELLLGIGGGGVMDAAKAGAALLREQAGDRTGPLVLAIPTTPGTGAQVTPFATVWDYERARKRSIAGRGVAPAAAVVDPELCAGLPRPVLAASALDALTQGAEAAWSTNSTPESTALGLSAVTLIAQVYEDLIAGQDLRALTTASLAGLMAGQAISISQTTACHAISYPLTLRHDLRHGDACSLTLGALLTYNGTVTRHDCVDARGVEHVRGVVKRVAGALGARTLPDAQRTIERFRRLGGLSAYRDCSPDSSAIAAEALTYERAHNNPRRLEREQLTAILRSLEVEESNSPC